MPPTVVERTPSLWISLERRNTNQPFAPGETIVGYVHRSAQLVTPNASIYIRLLGRTKSKMVVSTGNSRSIYRGRFNLLHDDATITKLFEGPVHIPPGGDAAVWPFTLTIPTHVSVKAVCAAPVEMNTFIPVVPAQVREHGLPPTMGAWDEGFSTTVQGFVEYFLKADIITTVGGRQDTRDATLPVILAPVLREPPIADFKLRPVVYPREVQTQLLLPGRHDDKLSIKEKFKKSMGTPSVPTLSLKFKVEIPTVLQMFNPLPMPFVVQLIPDWEKTTEKIRKEPQKVKLTMVELKIETTTVVNCEGTFSNKSDDTRVELNLGVWNRYKSTGYEIDMGQEGNWSAVDVGSLADIRLSPDSIPGLGTLDKELNCSWATYNVQQQHALMWKVHLDVAGEPLNVVGREKITILPASGGPIDQLPGPQSLAASEAWMQPPPEEEVEGVVQGEAPPSFAQVQRETAARS